MQAVACCYHSVDDYNGSATVMELHALSNDDYKHPNLASFQTQSVLTANSAETFDTASALESELAVYGTAT
jgi:hypothetical protein